MYEAGLIAVCAALVLLIKIPTHLIRRMLWLDVWMDVLVTFAFAWMLYGTYSGMTAALVAGLFFSIVLWAAKQIMGHEKPVLHWTALTRFHIEWIHVPGPWSKINIKL